MAVRGDNHWLQRISEKTAGVGRHANPPRRFQPDEANPASPQRVVRVCL